MAPNRNFGKNMPNNFNHFRESLPKILRCPKIWFLKEEVMILTHH